MSLLNDVRNVCRDLVEAGWGQFFTRIADLDIGKYDDADFDRLLLRKLNHIDRTRPGMADFAMEGSRAIEPGKPAHSLLFHVLASPGIMPPEVKNFPKLEDLEIIENYIYSVDRPSISDLRARCDDAPLAIVVFACEYRPVIQTVHQKHADMCYSRTGVARIGTAPPYYAAERRGYRSIGPDPTKVHVVPARYSAFISAALPAEFHNFGPMRPRKAPAEVGKARLATMRPQVSLIDTGGQALAPDDDRIFWVPLHKLFSGPECIRGLSIQLKFEHEHRNEKLYRLAARFQAEALIHPASGASLQEFPFVIDASELASMSGVGAGSVQVTPEAHPLAEEARSRGQRLAFKVPPGGAVSGGAFRVPSRPGGGRPAPEFVYVRQEIKPNDQLHNLNEEQKLVEKINRGQYKAQLYLDYTGDGWVDVECEELGLFTPRTLPAYSLLSPPDLYPAVKQQDFFDWWIQSAPPRVQQTLFPDFEGPLPSEPLSDVRLTANLRLRRRITAVASEPVFDSTDDTYTAIVSGLGSGKNEQTQIDSFDDERVSTLPDGAAGLFAPGWDVSMDMDDDDGAPNGTLHLSAYGGSIPFLEDARLCAAQSAFWPAVAPDTSRLYEPGHFPAVTPIPNSRLGWDGLKAPEVLRQQTSSHPGIVRFYSLSHTDYVLQSLTKGFDFKSIASVRAEEYELWTLLMARVYVTLGASSTHDKVKWAVVTFDKGDRTDPVLTAAQRATGMQLKAPYHFFLIEPHCITRSGNPLFVEASFDRSVTAFVTPDRVLYADTDNKDWRVREF